MIFTYINHTITCGPRIRACTVDRPEASMRLGALAIGVALIVGSPLGAEPKLDLRVSPAVSAAPATLQIRITIPPNPKNRAVAIVADSDAFFRSSELALAGEKSPRNIVIEYRSLPPGTYEIRSVLVDVHGEEVAVARSTATVTGLGSN